MTKQNDYEVCRTIFEKYVKTGAAYPIFMPNTTKLDISSTMERFAAAVKASGSPELSPLGEHVFDEAQNAVEVSLYRALTQFESELLQEKKVVDAVISTDSEGGSLFITGSFTDLLNWFFLDCADEKFGGEFARFLCIYRIFEPAQTLFDRIAQCLRNPGAMTTNNFDKDLIIARTRNALRLWIASSYYCDVEPDAVLLRKVLDLVAFLEKELDDLKIGPFVRRLVENPLDFPSALPPKSSVDLSRWTPAQLAEQLTLVDAFEYYATTPDELFAIGETTGAPHITTLTKRVEVVGGWVAACVLQSPKPWVTLQVFVAVLEKLFDLNNYNGVKAVLLGIDHPGVVRLRKVGKTLEKSERDFLLEIKQLVDTTDLYRKHVELLGDVPCIPYIGTHVRLMSEAYGKNAAKIQTDKGINFQPTRAVADVMYNYLRFQRFRYYEMTGQKVLEELYAQLVHLPEFSDEKLNALSASIQPLDRKEKKGIVSPNSVTAPRATKLGGLFGAKPRKLTTTRLETLSPSSPTKGGRSSSIGDGSDD
jgi:hypothetical protein